jgi:hypothetical protein
MSSLEELPSSVWSVCYWILGSVGGEDGEVMFLVRQCEAVKPLVIVQIFRLNISTYSKSVSWVTVQMHKVIMQA